jgi:DUF1016 N-terminal domain
MTKRKTTVTGLSKTSGQDGKPPAALPVDYANLLTDLKARVRAAVSVNRELILLYWDIGKIIVDAQNTKGYGKQVVEQLAEDLHTAFPKMDGFSPRNVWRMRAFYLAWTDESQKHQQPVGNLDSKILPQLVAELDGQNLPQPVAEIPWGHNVWLLKKSPTRFCASGNSLPRLVNLEALAHGDPTTADEMMPLIYQELHKLAAFQKQRRPISLLCVPI